MSSPSRVAVASLAEDRYSRLRLIPWWDQEKIRNTRVLVVGAGALGNEILKNLALLGFAQIALVDLDTIERSNLSRAVLFRESDIGSHKAEAAARATMSMSGDIRVQPFRANIVHECGLGLFLWSDVIIAGLDNREARLWINRAAWKTSRPWIDGAIEGINGIARVFLPGKAPCYECTLGETDWALLEKRMSCNLLLQEAATEGKVPTTPTISSIIAGIQVQEAVKLIHDMPTIASRGYIFEGLNHSSYVVEYTENPDCMSHYTLDTIIELPQQSNELTLNDLMTRAKADLGGPEVVIEFSREIIRSLECPTCNRVEEIFVPVGSVTREQGRCPHDRNIRIVKTLHSYSGEEHLATRKLDSFGLPLYDVFTARSGEKELSYLIAGDAPKVLGTLTPKETQQR